MVECEYCMHQMYPLLHNVLIDTWWNVNIFDLQISPVLYSRFNRYMVECELRIPFYCFGIKCVLIDTWWNVNEFVWFGSYYKYEVLIDTWWNVNRACHETRYYEDKVLIDTWWNVNCFVLCITVRYVKRFNRYMVECE